MGDTTLRRVLTWPVGPMFIVGRFAPSSPPPRAAAIIRRSDLPPELSALVADVVRQTRLWHREQADVARELVNHFQDAVNAGVAPRDAAESFGDPARAARLMSRAKRRARPLAWFAAVRALQTLALLVMLAAAIYIALLIRFTSASPTIAHNYLADLDAPARAVPEESRAWPQYREAYLAIARVPDEMNKQVAPGRNIMPGEPGWDSIRLFLREHQHVLDLVRSAAMRPSLGYIQGEVPDEEVYAAGMIHAGMDSEKARRYARNHVQHVSSEDRPLVWALSDVYVPRRFVRMLVADAHEAAQAGDSARAAADLAAIVGIASQLRQFPLTIGDQLGLVSLIAAARTTGELIDQRPGLFSDDQLLALAHALGGFGGGGRLRISLDGERATVRDLIQRIYSDDGSGDGRLTREGIELLAALTGAEHRGDALSRMLKKGSAHPILAAVVAGRADARREADRLFDDLEAVMSRAPWERQVPDTGRWSDDGWRIRYPALAVTVPDIERYIERAEHATVLRDAATVAIALELHRRRHGEFPRSLQDLTPALLPRVPADPFDGAPMKYRLDQDGGALVYIAGADGSDDGGRAPPPGLLDRESRRVRPHKLRSITPTAEPPSAEYDWILWPPSP